ncbi:MucBP domain-containing protein [Eubacterium sp. 1001713B170207_170306_E7]|uniref:MucBP domain-containing protein n=1 Tax=Eubacterium sp. 1001713B170207_170306_E7 TaxID=2787097 RepID=UPI0018989B06|nr:MucBP domain-containing protein [Eubacterium sp. 1001713B170207_170306_E7]
MTAFKKKMNRIVAVLMTAAMALLLMGTALPATAHAKEGSYNIEFKAGAQGTINGQSSVSVEVPYEGTLSLNDISVIPNDSDKYYFTGWNQEIEYTVTKKATYVAQYAKMISDTTYRVRYLDTYGNELLTQKVVPASVGGSVTVDALTIEGYIVDALAKTTIIAAEGTEIDFVYTPADNPAFETQPGVVTVTGQPGDTGTAATLPGGTGGTGGAGTTTGGGGTVTPADGPGNNPTENVDPNDTPLSPAEEENIDPNQTPLANAAKQVGGMGNLILIGVGILALLGVILAAILVRRKKKARQ